MPKFPSTPPGKARFPKFTDPDRKFKAQGEYSTQLIIPDETALPFIAQLESQYQSEWLPAFLKENPAEKAKVKRWTHNMPWKQLTERRGEGDNVEEVEVEGFKVFKFSMNASGVSKKSGKGWEMRPAIFDAQGNLLHPIGRNGVPDTRQAPTVDVGGGSTIKVAYSPNVYSAFGGGLSLRLEAVQVLDLRQGGGSRSAEDYAFGVEDGFTAEVEQPAGVGAGGDVDLSDTPF